MTAKQGFFRKYPNRVFVETGSFIGGGVKEALASGFNEIYSIELSDELHRICVGSFRAFPNVHFIHGDSRFVLEGLISKINEQITFWLDAHISGGITVGEDLPPLMEELDIIRKHHIKMHTILIDDLHCWNWNDALAEKILSINPKYIIKVEDGELSEKDIMTAEIKDFL
jgi:hypothetical protein